MQRFTDEAYRKEERWVRTKHIMFIGLLVAACLMLGLINMGILTIGS